MNNRKIISRVYYALDIELASPLSVSSGNNDNSDADVIRDHEGNPFVPGTSIAGAFRNYMNMDSDKKCAMGYSKGEEGRLSSISISDMFFDENSNISIRDHVHLNVGKTVENKFDTEIVETGAKATMFFCYVVREEDDDDYKKIVNSFINGLNEGFIRLGSRKNRGNGRFKINAIHSSEFTKDNVSDYLTFLEARKVTSAYANHMNISEWLSKNAVADTEYFKITVPLRLKGGISIRKYSTIPDQPDYIHITCNDVPVIPGSSFSGAIRNSVRKNMLELGLTNEQAAVYIDEWFGKVKDKRSDASYQSLVSIEESILNNSKSLISTRNVIDRFAASTKNGALFTELSNFGGETELIMLIKKDNKRHYKALIKMLDISIKDLLDGFISIGGQSGIGRGIFEADSQKQITYSDSIDKSYDEELISLIKEGR